MTLFLGWSWICRIVGHQSVEIASKTTAKLKSENECLASRVFFKLQGPWRQAFNSNFVPKRKIQEQIRLRASGTIGAFIGLWHRYAPMVSIRHLKVWRQSLLWKMTVIWHSVQCCSSKMFLTLSNSTTMVDNAKTLFDRNVSLMPLLSPDKSKK